MGANPVGKKQKSTNPPPPLSQEFVPNYPKKGHNHERVRRGERRQNEGTVSDKKKATETDRVFPCWSKKRTEGVGVAGLPARMHVIAWPISTQGLGSSCNHHNSISVIISMLGSLALTARVAAWVHRQRGQDKTRPDRPDQTPSLAPLWSAYSEV